MRIRVRGWHWRRNPLRRRCDVVEAWTLLVAAVLLAVGAPLAGVAAGRWAHDEARTLQAVQRAERHRVRAEVVARVPGTPAAVPGGRQHAYRATVRWSEPGTGRRTAAAQVPADTRPGDVVPVWFDSRGRSVAPPPDDTAVWQHTLTLGACAAGGTAAAVLLGRWALRRALLRHRLAEWEREWAVTGPEWTRRHA
ncbi:Rv1733c family protein [Streptomyces echinoruber]|uniref:Integral membrane protein n=1 Tax=Streptomyces echinoruber TaxID=68898 RepID=A0A918VKI9_9ACTN|nr:hypothetical protein [Streptomyces echinoruber]GHA03571.1 hypothetical protein GCM10010389_48670 [Streptomyces echinoruber]